MASYIDWGKRIYDMENPREVRRMAVFVARAILHNSGMSDLEKYFINTPVFKRLIEESPFPLEQATRAFFYKGSTFNERAKLIKEHFNILNNKIKDEILLNISSCPRSGYEVYRHDFEGEASENIRAVLTMEPGQRKEGLCSVELNLFRDDEYVDHLYQIMFWLTKDSMGNCSLYVGAMQGPNMTEAKDIIKRMTKACHGYRTKNLILYITQAIMRNLDIEKIYAVTNEGYYANNHARADRKLKTSFSDFWAEAGGKPTDDMRFYELPLVEERKTMEEVPTRKRAVYRRRFSFLDEIDKTIAENMKKILK